jgi:hypothetical protein
MIARLEETVDPREFGNCGLAHVKEAAALAKSLRFPEPPIQYSTEKIGPENPRPILLSHIRPGLTGQLRTSSSCRSIDPIGESINSWVIGGIVDAIVDGKSIVVDLSRAFDMTNARTATIISLRQWMRAMDGIIETSPLATSPDGGKALTAEELPPAVLLAWTQFQEAIGADAGLASAPSAKVYARAKQMNHHIVSFQTWMRYVRRAKAHHAKAD